MADMNIRSVLKKWNVFVGDENASSRRMTSSVSLRHRKVVTFDDTCVGDQKSKRQNDNNTVTKRDSKPREEPKRVLSPPGVSYQGGNINLLFCCEDDDHGNGFARLRVECGSEFGGRGKSEGGLQDATDIQYLGEGQLLVTDLVSSRLQAFDETGKVTRTYASEHVTEPWAAALTSDGRRLAVTSRKHRKVALLARDGGAYCGSLGQGHLSCPSGLAVTSQGQIIVTDIHTHTVSVFTAHGAFLRHLGGGSVTFHQPRYVTVSPQGDVIVSDSGHHRLVVFSQDGRFVRTVGGFGKDDGNFKFPHAVCTDSQGNILVCDRYNDRVSAFTRRGEFVRHLVTAEQRLRHPQGLVLTSEMDLYVSHGGLKASVVKVVHFRLRDVSLLVG